MGNTPIDDVTHKIQEPKPKSLRFFTEIQEKKQT